MKLVEKKLYRRTLKVKRPKPFKNMLTRVLFSLLKRKDSYTADHCKRVMRLTVGYAKYYNYPQEKVSSLKYASLLHDIGKIAVSKGILRKPEKLSEIEFNQVKKHPLVGSLILKKTSQFRLEADIIRDHHERIDGTGYPRGLCGSQIPELSKILSVCDAFDAMTKYRVYRQSLSRDEALEELLKNTERQFDRATVERFCSYLGKKADSPSHRGSFTNDIE